MTAIIASGLTEQQRELVKYIVGEGRPPEEAAELAGYHPKFGVPHFAAARGGGCRL